MNTAYAVDEWHNGVTVMDKDTLLHIVKSEIERTTGCTDPVSIALAVSRAVRELGCVPDEVEVVVSPNLYKNAINVGIPGTGKRGMVWAAALGAVIDNSDAGLAILDAVDEAAMRAAGELIEKRRVCVGYDQRAPDAQGLFPTPRRDVDQTKLG